MIYQLDNITKDVRICLDQNRVSDTLISDGDEETLMLDEVIQSKVLEAVERVHMMAPHHKLEVGHTFDTQASSIYWGSHESGWVQLPLDFMRFVSFCMSDWERPVYDTISPESPEYKRQRCRIKALRGTAQRPVCAIVTRPEGKVLEFYSCKTNSATATSAIYIPRPTIDANGGVDICEDCYESVVSMIAGLALTSIGDVEMAKNYLELARTLIEK